MAQSLDIHNKNILASGYTVIDDILSVEQIAEAQDCLSTIYARENNLSPLLNQAAYQRSLCLIYKEKIFRAICQNPEILDLVRSLLGSDFILGSLNALSTKPHAEQQHLHFDQIGVPGALSMLIVVFPLDHSTLNGCLRLIPGSQTMVHATKIKADSASAQFAHLEDKAIHIEAPAGSVIVFNGLTLHAVGQNRSEKPSRVVIATYSRKWVKPLFDFVKSTPPHISVTFTEKEKQLFGYHDPHPVHYDYKKCNVYSPSALRRKIDRCVRIASKLTSSIKPYG